MRRGAKFLCDCTHVACGYIKFARKENDGASVEATLTLCGSTTRDA